MLLFNRRKFLLVSMPVLAGLSGCGFEPVYGRKSDARDMLSKIDIEVKDGRNAFEMRDRLIERLGHGGKSAPYELLHKITVKSDDLVVSDAFNVTRYTLQGFVEYQIIARADSSVVFSGRVQSNTAYSATSGTFPADVAERDANTRLMRDLADNIAIRLSVTAKDWLR